MTLPMAMTRQACRVHRALPEDLKRRVDRLILGLRLVPDVGLYDKRTEQFTAHLNHDEYLLKLHYKIVEAPKPQLVVLAIHDFPKTALAGIYERLRAECRAALAG